MAEPVRKRRSLRQQLMTMVSIKKLVVEDYNPEWAHVFQRERALVERAMGEKLIAIEHVGSTAVPGLGAKPIVDILAGVHSLGDVDGCL